MRKYTATHITLLSFSLVACAPTPLPGPITNGVPALDYAQRVRSDISPGNPVGERFSQDINRRQRLMPSQAKVVAANPDPHGERARMHPVKDYSPDERRFLNQHFPGQKDIVHNLDDSAYGDRGYEVYHSAAPVGRDYNGPLSLGDPGTSASLWQESRATNNLFRDYRAFQPMDLITIIVSESSEGTKEADTEVKKESEFLAGITNFFNFETDAEAKNPGLDTTTLINADVTDDFKGEGDTTRKGSLTAKISAMVVEVLPSGILRVEGEKIISVNNEEQVLIISGLIRTRDISSNNEVQSSKIANLRVDYYGRGDITDAQRNGWFTKIVRKLWPF